MKRPDTIKGLCVSDVALRPAARRCRATSGAIILFVLLDGAIKLMSWPMVTQAMDRLDHGSSEYVARFLGAINLICAAACAFPPTSFVSAILTAGYLERALVSHLEIGGALVTAVLSGLCLGVALLGGLWLRDRRSRRLASFAS